MSFLKQVNAGVANIKTKTNRDIERIAIDLHSKIIAKTPVGAGRGIDKKTGEHRKGLRESWELAKIPNGYVISNKLPYAHVVEFGLYPNPPKGGKGKTKGGYSTQAPQGMVRISIKEVADKWK